MYSEVRSIPNISCVAKVVSAGADGISLIVENSNCSGCTGCAAHTPNTQSPTPFKLQVVTSRAGTLTGNLMIETGDSVNLQLPSGALIAGSSLVYLLPVLLMLLFGCVASRFVSAADLVVAVSATTGLLAGFLIVKAVMRRAETGQLTPLVAVLAKERTTPALGQ